MAGCSENTSTTDYLHHQHHHRPAVKESGYFLIHSVLNRASDPRLLNSYWYGNSVTFHSVDILNPVSFIFQNFVRYVLFLVLWYVFVFFRVLSSKFAVLPMSFTSAAVILLSPFALVVQSSFSNKSVGKHRVLSIFILL